MAYGWASGGSIAVLLRLCRSPPGWLPPIAAGAIMFAPSLPVVSMASRSAGEGRPTSEANFARHVRAQGSSLVLHFRHYKRMHTDFLSCALFARSSHFHLWHLETDEN